MCSFKTDKKSIHKIGDNNAGDGNAIIFIYGLIVTYKTMYKIIYL